MKMILYSNTGTFSLNKIFIEKIHCRKYVIGNTEAYTCNRSQSIKIVKRIERDKRFQYCMTRTVSFLSRIE